MKVLLILADGMRPDGLCDIPEVQEMMKKSSYTLKAQTVFPSVTLPCHISLFHSVDPIRHGTTTNYYAPQVRPIKGLCEVLLENEKSSVFFHSWEALRECSRPDSLDFSYYVKADPVGGPASNSIVTDAAIDYLAKNDKDFTFLYLGYPDMAGHEHGWMSDEYMYSVRQSWENIDKIVKTLSDDYTVIVTADHGGHNRTHGTDLPEDMIIPLFIMGKDYIPGAELSDVNIKDIAPTVTHILGVEADGEWEGKIIKNN